MEMAEYIERSAAIKAAKHAWAKGLEPSQYIEALPAADVALHQTEGWGYDRIMRITHNWVAVQREYKPALDCRNPEADVCQEHMDRVLAEIIRNRMILIRFPERYPHVKKIKYGR